MATNDELIDPAEFSIDFTLTFANVHNNKLEGDTEKLKLIRQAPLVINDLIRHKELLDRMAEWMLSLSSYDHSHLPKVGFDDLLTEYRQLTGKE